MSAPLSRHAIQDEVDAYLETLFDRKLDLILYLRAGERLLHEAASYEAEGNHEEAYRKLFTYVELAATWYPRHPQYKDKRCSAQLAKTSQRAYKAMGQLAELKPKVEARYERYAAEKARQADRAKQVVDRSALSSKAASSIETKSKRSPVQIDEALLQTVRNLSLSQSPASRYVGESTTAKAFEYPEVPVARQESSITLSAPTIPPKLAQPSRGTVSKTEVPKSSDSSLTQFPEVATLESGQPLKTVFVSNRLREVFLTIAKPNTDRKLETCGILAGSCRNNAYFVTHLIIPKQESTSDTCATTDEEGLFNLQDENDLFTIGWIHVSSLSPPHLSPGLIVHSMLTSGALR